MPSSVRDNCGIKSNEENRRLLKRIVLDLVILVILVIPIIVCEYVLEPFRRGFFCNDESIRYPFKTNTITPATLLLILGLPPVIVLIIGEYSRHRYKGQLGNTRQIFGCNVATWLLNFFQQLVYFFFGILLALDATELAKYTIGRLRPHFMAVCQPQLTDGTTCYDAINQHRYVENYFCLGNGFTIQDMRQARLSFPSGHSSLIFYATIYMALYLQKRIHWRRSHLSIHFLQFSFIMSGWFIALSRIMDNWHHWSDVLLGSLIGIIVALTTANYVSKFFRSYYMEFDMLNLPGLTREATSVTLSEVLTPTPPPYTTNKPSTDDLINENCTKM